MSETQEDVVDSTASAAAAPPASTEPTEASAAPTTEPMPTPAKPPDSTRPSALPKPSGLKLPSKIGRLCSNSAPKPAVPISPRADGGSTDTVRKLSDELSRKHLSDLIEAEEDEVTSSLPERLRSQRKASTASSTFSVTSMDTLWEKHPRRLSEAGLRRSSDHSVVLTEDTDSFIIGERVWVGGTKPGQIAYIGETQFAPGDWAGIVLDEPIGKNDGSVAGFRYFQCGEKRGVFSRLTRLTRVPLVSHAAHDASPASDAGSVFDRPPSGAAIRSRGSRALSPNGSIRSAVSSRMNASISTTTPPSSKEVGLGDRVIVSSSRGSKAGILRYVGVTDFAPGVWAGVELDDPLGKNDGSVDGKRYFECSPRFGLFAPISKVSRSPSNRKPGQCAIHNNGNGRTTPLRRTGSRDSLTSLGTSIASSRIGVRAVPSLAAQRLGGPRASSTPVSAKGALQELLREKQSHLERLMKERDLERAEVAKATLQADRAETALAHLKKEASQANDENVRLKSELDKLQKQLEDERQKVEDLMFRSEEENINREDYEKYKDAMEAEKSQRDQRIRELEAEVALQRSRVEAAAEAARLLEQHRAAEAASIADNHRQELAAAHTLSAELQKLLDEAYALLKEKENEKDSIGKSMSEELSRVKIESEKALNEAKTKLAIAQTEFETQMSVLNGKLQLAESKFEAEQKNLERLNKENSQTIIDLNSKISQLQAMVDDKTQELNKVTGSSKEHEVNLNKEITKLKMELSAKVLDIEQLTESHKNKEIAYKNLEGEMSRLKQECAAKVTELELILNETTQLNEHHKEQISQLQQNLSAKIKDYERLLNESTSTTSLSEKIITEYKQTIHERDKEIVKLKDEFEQATANFNVSSSKIAELHKKEIEEQNNKIAELIKEIDTQKQTLEHNKLEFDNLTAQFTSNADELKVLKEENDQLKKTISDLTKTNTEAKEKISCMELEIGELKRHLEGVSEKCAEIQKAKDKIEQEYMNLTGQASNSNEQFNQLTQHLKDTERELQETKDKHREALNNHGRIEQELKQKICKIEEEFALERTQLVKSNDENCEKINIAEKKIQDYELQLNALKNRLKDEESNKDKLIDENTNLKKDIEALKVKETESQRKQMESAIEKYKEEISILKAEGATSEVKLMEKVDQLIEAQNELNNKLEEARRHEDALQKVIDDITTRLNNQKSQYEQEIATVQNQLASTVTETSTLKEEENRLKELLSEKENCLKTLSLKLEMLEVDVKSNFEMSSEKERQLSQANEELTKVTKAKKELEDKLNNSVLESSNMRQMYENLISNSSAGETLLKDQQDQLENLRKDLNVTTQEKLSLETKCTEALQELSHLKSEQETMAKRLKDNIDTNNNLQHFIEDKDRQLKSQAEKMEADVVKSKALENELTHIKQELEGKIRLLETKENELRQLNELLQAGNNDSQQKVKTLQDEYNQLNEKHKNEIEALTNSCNSLKTRIAEQEKQIDELQKTNEKVIELQSLLEKSESDIKQLTSINEGQKSNYEDLNQQLQTQCSEYKKECKRIKHDYKARIVEYEKELESSKDKLKQEMEKHTELQQKLEEAAKNVVDLSNKLELMSVQNNTNVDKDDKLEKITLELQALRKSSTEELQNCNTKINALKSEIENKQKELKTKEDLLTKSSEDLRKYIAKVEIAEREKVLLQKELSSRPKEGIIKDKNDNREIGQGDEKSQKITEEAEIVAGQVSFLNSVIVDMQRKNEQLMARVQALEGGQPDRGENMFAIRAPRTPAPRLFCDICEEFDRHDTDDCDRQASADAAPPPPRARKPPPAPRPYCDICEVFGHSTENCDEEETF